ncbi:3-dehydroquinate synthase family protein [Salinarimonas chemoclinalis]|uniref:3-dehydroquinate synthase family protein n=1 Tax=Salinarimonas chemoclinalis TaxID=3241599 RepID=UPI0035579219
MRSVKASVFDIIVERGALKGDSACRILDFEGRKCLLVSTPSVYRLYGETVRRHLAERDCLLDVLILEMGEGRKFMPAVLEVAERAQRVGLDRRGIVVALGGGVVGDVVSFAASMIRRGIGHVRIPTTLMAQIDAAIGIKGGVNFNRHKNFLGCFHPPEAVLVDPNLLRSLPVDAIRQGMAEIVKIAMIRDVRLFELLEQHGETLIGTRFGQPAGIAEEVVVRAIDGMVAELSSNPYEDATLERHVDLGHMISPLLEVRSNYQLHHGEAVAVDLAYTSCIANDIGHLDDTGLLRVLALLRRLGLPTDHEFLDEELALTAFTATERHRGGTLNLPVPTGIGTCGFVRRRDELPEGIVTRTLARLAASADLLADADRLVVV